MILSKYICIRFQIQIWQENGDEWIQTMGDLLKSRLWKYSLAMNLYHIYQNPVWLHAAGNLTCQQSFSSEHRGCPQKLPEPSTKIHLSKGLEERCHGHYRNCSLSSFGARQIHLFTFPAQVEIPMSLIFNQLYFPISHSWLTHLPWQIAELIRTRKSSL